MDTIAKQLEIAKLEIVTLTGERDALKGEASTLTQSITVNAQSIEILKSAHAVELEKISKDLKASQDATAEAVRLAGVRAAEIAAAAGHPPVASAPTEQTAASTPETLWAEYHTIKNPMDKARFYQAHKELWPK